MTKTQSYTNYILPWHSLKINTRSQNHAKWFQLITIKIHKKGMVAKVELAVLENCFVPLVQISLS